MYRRTFLGVLTAATSTAVAGCTSSCPPLGSDAEPPTAATWPAPHGDTMNRGRAAATWGPESQSQPQSTDEPPTRLWELWQYRDEDRRRGTLSSPVVGEDYVFVVDGLPRVYTREPAGGTVFAIDPQRSEPAWHKRLETAPAASPALSQRAVVVPQTDGTLRAFDRLDGTERWQHTLDGVPATPTIVDDHLYVGDSQGTVIALDLDGESCWSIQHGPWIEGFGFGHRPSAQYKMATDNDTVYTILTATERNRHPERGRLVALAREDGHERWEYTFQTGREPPRTPAVNSGTDTVFLPGGRTLHAVETGDGTERWRYAFGTHYPVSTPAVGDERLYVCNKNVYAIDPTDGTERWRFVNRATGRALNSRRPLTASPVVAGETVYAGLGALDATSGTPRWGEFGNQTDSEYFSPSPDGDLTVTGPALTPNALYASLQYGGLVRFGRVQAGGGDET